MQDLLLEEGRVAIHQVGETAKVLGVEKIDGDFRLIVIVNLPIPSRSEATYRVPDAKALDRLESMEVVRMNDGGNLHLQLLSEQLLLDSNRLVV